MAGITDAISGVSGAVTALVTSVAAPLITDAEAQKYEKQYANDLADIQASVTKLLAGGGGADLDVLSERLCIAAGTPSPGDLGPVVTIPVGRLVAHLVISAGKRRSDAYLAQFTHKAVS